MIIFGFVVDVDDVDGNFELDELDACGLFRLFTMVNLNFSRKWFILSAGPNLKPMYFINMSVCSRSSALPSIS